MYIRQEMSSQIQCPLFNCVHQLFTYFITNSCYYVPSSVPWEQMKANSWVSCLLFATKAATSSSQQTRCHFEKIWSWMGGQRCLGNGGQRPPPVLPSRGYLRSLELSSGSLIRPSDPSEYPWEGRWREVRRTGGWPPTGSLSLAAGLHTSLRCRCPALPAPCKNRYTMETLGRECEASRGAGHVTCA